MKISRIDRDGYVIKEFFLWDDVSANEKKRLWLPLASKPKDFSSYRIDAVAIGDVSHPGAKDPYWLKRTEPRLRLDHVFAKARNLGRSFTPRWIIVAVAMVLIALFLILTSMQRSGVPVFENVMEFLSSM